MHVLFRNFSFEEINVLPIGTKTLLIQNGVTTLIKVKGGFEFEKQYKVCHDSIDTDDDA
jgi:hypothetical protein